MTQEQYDRWRQFALAMARGVWPHMTDRRRAKLIGEIEFFFDNTSEADWSHFTGWDQVERHPDSDGSGRTSRHSHAYCCDMFSEAFDRYFDSYHNGHVDDCQVYYDHQWFYDQLSCCIRAGIDIALEAGPGVIGFTVGDVRRMFDGEPPPWVFAGYDNIGTALDTDGIWL